MDHIREKRLKLIAQVISQSIGRKTVPSKRPTMGESTASQSRGPWLDNEFSEHTSPNSSRSTSDGRRTIESVSLTIQAEIFRRCLIDKGYERSEGAERN